jgi:hypothetical protein
MFVISRKAYRFTRPNTKAHDLIASLTKEQANKLSADEKMYCDVRGGSVPGAWGEPTLIPDWAAEDGMFKAAQANRNLIIVPEGELNPEKVIPQVNQDKAAIASTLAAAASSLNPPLANTKAGDISLGGEVVDKDNLAPADDTAELVAPSGGKKSRSK